MMAICHSKVQKLLNGNILTNLSNTHVSSFLYSLWSVKIHVVIQTSKEIDRVCIMGLDFFTLNKGFTNVTNQERHPKQMERQSKKSNLNSY